MMLDKKTVRKPKRASRAQRLAGLCLLAGLVGMLGVGGQMTLAADAQTNRIVWSRPVNLSNSLVSSGRPAIVADGYGKVDVFWSEEVGGPVVYGTPQALIRTGNTLFLSQWDGVSWSTPIDLLFVKGDQVADYVAATVDASNQIHLVWTGSTNFYYSTAPADKALSALNWSQPEVVASGSARTQWESSIVTDKQGRVHIAYATGGSQPGVYHTYSADEGHIWTVPEKLSLPFDEVESSFSNVKIITDGAGRLHVVWQTNQDDGFGQSIYYARSVDGGETWAPPVRIAQRDPGEYGVTFPWIVAVGDSELHMVYVDGPWHIGRYHRISHDGGATWGEPVHVMQDFEGINGYPILLVDGASQLHWVQTWRTRSQIGGTYYAQWLGNSWSPMELAVREDENLGPGAHWTAATIRLGNDIHIVWNTNFTDKAGEIWHTHGIIPGLAPATVMPTPSATPQPTPTPTPSPVLPTATVPAAGAGTLSAALPKPPTSNLLPLVFVFVPLLALLGGVLVWTLIRPKA